MLAATGNSYDVPVFSAMTASQESPRQSSYPHCFSYSSKTAK